MYCAVHFVRVHVCIWQVLQWIEEEKRQRKLVSLLKGQRDIKQTEALRAQQAEKETAEQVRRARVRLTPHAIQPRFGQKGRFPLYDLYLPRQLYSRSCMIWVMLPGGGRITYII